MPIDTIDFTDLKRRGLLKESQEEKEQNVPDYFDFSAQPQQSPETEPTQSAEPSSGFDFLNTFAANATPTPDPTYPTQSTQQNSQDNQDLAIRLENLEYQLERLTEKLSTFESKVLAFEEKVK